MDEREHFCGPSCLFRAIAAILVFAVVVALVSWIVGAAIRGTGTFTMPFGGYGFVWDLIWLLFVIWLLSWLFRGPHRHRHGRYWYEDEMDIARKRYAAGEISRKEYLAIVKDLRDTEY